MAEVLYMGEEWDITVDGREDCFPPGESEGSIDLGDAGGKR